MASTEQQTGPGVPRQCDIPFCATEEVPMTCHGEGNLICQKCHKFFCTYCTMRTALVVHQVGVVDGEAPSIPIWEFTCPLCRKWTVF